MDEHSADDEADRVARARAGDEHADRYRYRPGRDVIADDSDPQRRDGCAHALHHTAGDEARERACERADQRARGEGGQ